MTKDVSNKNNFSSKIKQFYVIYIPAYWTLVCIFGEYVFMVIAVINSWFIWYSLAAFIFIP